MRQANCSKSVPISNFTFYFSVIPQKDSIVGCSVKIFQALSKEKTIILKLQL